MLKAKDKSGLYRILSWGCGVQSTTLAAMSALGEIEPLDVILTSDLGWERRRTVEVRDWYVDWLRERGLYVEVIQAGDIRLQGADEHVHIPFWTSDGGPLLRQCTRHFKIRPIRRRVRELLGYPASIPPSPPAGSVEQWIGFSLDEWERIKVSGVQYMVNRFPLVERKMLREDCKNWLRDRGLPVPVKSSCVGCPYRSSSEWLEMREQDPGEFAEAVVFDEQNRCNPLAERGASTADELYIWKDARTQRPGPLVTADLELAAAVEKDREKDGFQIPLMLCGGPCGT